MTAPDLGSTSVFVDFDGTISTADVGVHLMNRLVGDAWLDIEDLYERRLIGSRQCMQREWDLLPNTDESLLRSVAAEVPVDPDVGALFEGLLAAGAEVTVLSDGFGFYVWDVGSALGVPVLTARADFTTGDLTFPYEDAACPCAQCGTCKRSPVEQAAARGRKTVFIGDGNSDRHVAPVVDTLYAKDALARWCDAEQIAYRPFGSLGEVADDLGLSPP